MDCEPVTNRHERTRVVIPIISPAVMRGAQLKPAAPRRSLPA